MALLNANWSAVQKTPAVSAPDSMELLPWRHAFKRPPATIPLTAESTSLCELSWDRELGPSSGKGGEGARRCSRRPCTTGVTAYSRIPKKTEAAIPVLNADVPAKLGAVRMLPLKVETTDVMKALQADAATVP